MGSGSRRASSSCRRCLKDFLETELICSKCDRVSGKRVRREEVLSKRSCSSDSKAESVREMLLASVEGKVS